MLPGCAYFNTFYNAKQLFNESQKVYGKEEKKDHLPSKTVESLNKAATKAQKVITQFPDSKYVDDAMYYFGVCNFQLGKYLIAQKQLSELVLNYPRSEYSQQAKLWIAKCYFRQNKEDMAFSILERFINDKKNKKYFGDAMRLAGYLALEENNDEKTFFYFNKAIVNTKDNAERNQLLYDLTVIYTDKNMLDEALHTLKKTVKISNNLAMLMDIKLQYIKIYRLQKQYTKSENLIEEMLKNLDYEKAYPKLEVELGLIFYNKNQIDKAILHYESVIKNYKNTTSASLASYYLGEIYLFEKMNFFNAKNHYQKVKGKELKSKIIDNAAKKAKLINNYIKIENERKKLIKKTPMLLDQPKNYYDILKYPSDTTYSLIDSSKIDTLGEITSQVDSLILLKLDQFKKDANNYGQIRFNEAEYFVFYFEQVDSALSIYQNISSKFPYIDIIPQILNTWAFVLETEKSDTIKADSLRDLMAKEFPKSPLTYHYLGQQNPDSVRYRKDQKQIYEIEKSFVDEKKYLQAIDKFQDLVMNSNLDSTSIAHAYYQIAWLYDYKLIELDSTIDEAMKYYKIITDNFPKTPFAKISQKRIKAINKMIEDKAKAIQNPSKQEPQINEKEKLIKDKFPTKEKKLEKKDSPDRKRPTFIRKRNLEE